MSHASRLVSTHPGRLLAIWIFFLQALPCRCIALLPWPPPWLLHRLSMLSNRLLPGLTWMSSPTTPPSCGVVLSSFRHLGDQQQLIHLLRLLLQHPQLPLKHPRPPL